MPGEKSSLPWNELLELAQRQTTDGHGDDLVAAQDEQRRLRCAHPGATASSGLRWRGSLDFEPGAELAAKPRHVTVLDVEVSDRTAVQDEEPRARVRRRWPSDCERHVSGHSRGHARTERCRPRAGGRCKRRSRPDGSSGPARAGHRLLTGSSRGDRSAARGHGSSARIGAHRGTRRGRGTALRRTWRRRTNEGREQLLGERPVHRPGDGGRMRAQR